MDFHYVWQSSSTTTESPASTPPSSWMSSPLSSPISSLMSSISSLNSPTSIMSPPAQMSPSLSTSDEEIDFTEMEIPPPPPSPINQSDQINTRCDDEIDESPPRQLFNPVLRLQRPTSVPKVQSTSYIFDQLPFVPQLRSWAEFENLMEYAIRNKKPEMLKQAVVYANRTPIPSEYQNHCLNGQRLMQYFRGIVSSNTQARLLSSLLQFPIEFYFRPGSFIKEALTLRNIGAFDHHSCGYNPKAENPLFNKYHFQSPCCRRGKLIFQQKLPFEKFRYCLCCDKVFCLMCNGVPCEPKMIRFIESSKSMQIYNKKKLRVSRCSRPTFSAVGPIFPHDQLETLEDCFLFQEFIE